jgi:hypothetical protein
VKALQAADEAIRDDRAGTAHSSSDSAESRTTQNDSAESRTAQNDSAESHTSPASWSERQADALTLVAETLLAHGPRGLPAGDRHLVHVHVNVSALAPLNTDTQGDDVQCHLHDGPALARDVVRRFACDASVVALLENAQGEVLDVGRKTRAIPPALRRALQHRDKGCRFPGCLSTRFVDAHHIEHWANGGATRLSNLVLLCRHHHSLVHEGGFTLAVERGQLVVRTPSGRVLEHAPAVSALREAGDVAIRRNHAERGIEIDARTGVPGWGGERADYDYLVAMLQERDACCGAG